MIKHNSNVSLCPQISTPGEIRLSLQSLNTKTFCYFRSAFSKTCTRTLSRICILLFLFLCFLSNESIAKRTLHVCQWMGYFDPHVLKKFEKETDIHVAVHDVESNEVLESILLASSSGYDLVFPSATPHFKRLQALGVFLKLDLQKLPNLQFIDPQFFTRVGHDLCPTYGVPYMWGTTGIAYNIPIVRTLLSKDPPHTWGLLYDPETVSKLAPRGVILPDSATEIFPVLKIYHHHIQSDASSNHDIEKIKNTMQRIRPFVQKFKGMESLQALARGEACIAQMGSGEALRLSQWAKDNLENQVDIGFILPNEGSILWVDMMAIPQDAPHIEEAYQFLNFLMRPDVMAANSLYTQYANPGHRNIMRSYLPETFLNHNIIYPTAAAMKRLQLDTMLPLEDEIAQTRLMTEIILNTLPMPSTLSKGQS